MDELLSDILTGKVKAKLRPSKRWLPPEALDVFKHWHNVIRANLEEGDAGTEAMPNFRDWPIDTKGNRTETAWRITGAIFSISPREAKRLYFSQKR